MAVTKSPPDSPPQKVMIDLLLEWADQKPGKLATAMGVDPQVVNNWRTRGLPWERVVLASDSTGIPLNRLLRGVDAPDINVPETALYRVEPAVLGRVIELLFQLTTEQQQQLLRDLEPLAKHNIEAVSQAVAKPAPPYDLGEGNPRVVQLRPPKAR